MANFLSFVFRLTSWKGHDEKTILFKAYHFYEGRLGLFSKWRSLLNSFLS